MEALSVQSTLSRDDVVWWLDSALITTGMTEMLLEVRLHAIAQGRYMLGECVETIYVEHFRPVWLAAPSTKLPHRNVNLFADLKTCCGESRAEAVACCGT